MALSESNLTNTARFILSNMGSIAATTLVARGFALNLLPPELKDHVFSGVCKFLSRFSNKMTLVIDDFDGLGSNQIYEAAETYLAAAKARRDDIRRLKVCKSEQENSFNIAAESDEAVLDFYRGEKFKWVWSCTSTAAKVFHNPGDRNSTVRHETRSFHLTFHRKNKRMALDSYLAHIINVAKNKKHEKKTIKIHTVAAYQHMQYNINDIWAPVTLNHPATFDTLAMDTDQKEMILNDLDRFVSRREHYRKVGKAWKRGYLLYGPPGTGKSSLIAAIANYLNYDVYDLELTDLTRNSDLRRLLLATANRSILVVEDIDCTIDMKDRFSSTEQAVYFPRKEENKQVTLSSLLNFVDGLWSSCGDERIIIFTTNHIEKLDPALLRPGRMDVHINMSYCTPCGFKLLASNYLGIQDHALFKKIEHLIAIAKVTPAEIGELLLKNDEPVVCLQGLIDFMHCKIKENHEEAIGEYPY
ncbi:AAA-ATPase At3g50940-like [Henckelia pumila]|uniref:AAA-ATPase At3g50940-like n=1 Tax=Henckelia pumila TaxID=405737 RepID=UPI003C6E27C7